MANRNLPTVKPLSARSVVLSTLLGYHPPALPVNALIRVGALFDMPERTVRVALTRMAADGDVLADNGLYRLTERLVERQARQDEASSPHTKRWRGGWEMAVVTTSSRPLAERVALRRAMFALRLAELREGVWLRPANLTRKIPANVADQCSFFNGRPEGDPLALTRQLWDLDAWAAEARRLQTALGGATELKDGFMISTEIYRHLLIDPVLPPELAPDDWPATDLHDQFGTFMENYRARLREYSQPSP
jgi:phenylacetic acid degradation operon negative regulatory protein